MGAGVLDLPGEVDVYSISLTKGETCHLKMHPGSLGLDWKLTNPYGEVVFDSSEVESFSPKPLINSSELNTPGSFTFKCSARLPIGSNMASICKSSLLVWIQLRFGSFPSFHWLPELEKWGWSGGCIDRLARVGRLGCRRLCHGYDVGHGQLKSLVDSDPDRKRLEALREFIDSLPEQIPLQLGLVDFDQYANLVQPLTASRDAITDRLEDFDASGGTNIERGPQCRVG